MIRNYFKITFRVLFKNKVFSMINILGLAIGIATFILIALYVHHELSFDRYHAKADRIYRVVEDLSTENERLFQSTSSPTMGPALAEEFPEVIAYVRFNHWGLTIKKDGQSYREENVYIADSSVFDVFSFPLLEGDPKTALTEPFSIVLTQSTAQKYFGDDEALGKTLDVNNNPFKVTGILKDIPENSHFTFDMLFSFSTWSRNNKEEEAKCWFCNNFHTYILLEEGEHQIENLRAKMPGFIKKYIEAASKDAGMKYDDLPLQPLTSIYLEKSRSWENGKRGSVNNIYILSVIAVFILLTACFNYINLATARASRRVKEVGLRKVLGAERRALIQQFLGESILISLVSTMLGLAIALLVLSAFNTLSGTSLTADVIFTTYGLTMIGALGIIIGLASGCYPALLVSGFHPLMIFKKLPGMKYGGNSLRKMLVSGQFIISIALIAGMSLVLDQLSFLRNKKLGFEKEKTLILDLGGTGQNMEVAKNEFMQIPGVIAASASNTVPGQSTNNQGWSIEVETGKMSMTNINTYTVDVDFLTNYKMSMVAGRAFSKDFPSDDSIAFVINETAARNLGWKSPEMAIGKKVDRGNKKGVIIGVVKDFYYKSLHTGIEPLLLHVNIHWTNILSLKLQSDNIPEVVEQIKTKWASLVPGATFQYSFLDQDYDRLYKAEEQLAKVVSVFSMLAIFVACLGLFGLTSFAVERRVKEIGIRKVLGASVRSVVFLLSNEFMRLIGIAFLVATPVTYYIIDRWLENFADRITINPLPFLLAGLSVFITAWITISTLSVKAASANPVNSLRND